MARRTTQGEPTGEREPREGGGGGGGGNLCLCGVWEVWEVWDRARARVCARACVREPRVAGGEEEAPLASRAAAGRKAWARPESASGDQIERRAQEGRDGLGGARARARALLLACMPKNSISV